MATLCVIHKKVMAAEGICGTCKSCKHTSWFKKENTQIWQCNNCYKTSKNPVGEKHILTNGKWET